MRRRASVILLFSPAVTLGCMPADDRPPLGHFDDPPPTVEMRSVSVSEGTELVAQVSPDGRWVAFILLGEVWLVERSGGRAVRLTDAETVPHQNWSIAWAPDSRKLGIWSESAEKRGIRVIDIESGDVRVIYDDEDLFEPAWSPRGETLTAVEISGDSSVLWSLRADGAGAPDRIATLPRPAANLAYAPDDRVMAYAGPVSEVWWIPTWESDLWERDLATGAERQLTADSALDAYPAYSSDGSWIAFLSERSGSRQVWVLPRDGGQARALTHDAEDVYLAPLSWLPDSRAVAYTAAGKIRIASLENAAEGTVEFTADLNVAYWRGLRRPQIPEPGERRRARGIVTPELSPDGTLVAFAALGDLWVAGLDGDLPRRLTRTPETEMRPRWSPDGARVAYLILPAPSLEAGQRGPVDRGIRVLDLDRPHVGRAVPVARAHESTEPAWSPEPDYVWSPDGRRLAYLVDTSVGWADLESGESHVVATTTGNPWLPTLLGWLPGGDTIVFSTGTLPSSMSEARQDRQVWRVSVDRGVVAEWPVPGDYSLRARWTPDLSRAAYAVGGFGYHAEVQGPAEPVRLSDPDPRFYSWSANGGSLLYLSGDQVRLLDVASGTARSIDVPPEYVVPAPPEPLLIRNARVIDGTGAAPSPPADVLVADGRLREIAPPGRIRTPPDSREIDATGHSLLPGLFNLHTHYGPSRPPSAVPLYYGVLAVRDMAAPAEWMHAERERIRAGDVLAPRVFMSGGVVVRDFGGAAVNQRAVDTGEPASVEGVLGSVAALGADVIKPYYNNPMLDARVSEAAHAHGLPMTSHYLFPGSFVRGLEGKEHSHLYYRDWTAVYREDVLSALRAAGTCVTLTLTTYSNRLAGRSPVFPLDSALFEDPALTTLFASEVLETWRELLDRPASDQSLAQWGELFQKDLENARRLHDAGILIATGTDAFPPADELGVLLEMELLVRAGLTPLQAIRAATFDAARCLGVEDRLGSVEVGKLADLIIVDGDPAADIRDARQIVWVVLGGKPYSRQDILNEVARTR